MRLPSERSHTRLERAKPWLETVQSVCTILAILAGYVWFLEQRSDKPNIKLDQIVSQREVEGDAKKKGSNEQIPNPVLITVDVRATNIGKVKVDLDSGTVKLLNINPGGDHALSSSTKLRPTTLEPGETDQALFTTWMIPGSVHTLQISSSYAVLKTSDYWTLVSAVDLGAKESRRVAASSLQ